MPTSLPCPSAWNQSANSHYAIARVLWEATGGVGLSGADSKTSIAKFLARSPGTSYVALGDAKLVATILVGYDGWRGQIHHLAVAASHRRQGIGKRLVAEGLAALEQAGKQKCNFLVFAENSEGRQFWQRVGTDHRGDLVVFSLWAK